jgi:hypothetical protein
LQKAVAHYPLGHRSATIFKYVNLTTYLLKEYDGLDYVDLVFIPLAWRFPDETMTRACHKNHVKVEFQQKKSAKTIRFSLRKQQQQQQQATATGNSNRQQQKFETCNS